MLKDSKGLRLLEQKEVTAILKDFFFFGALSPRVIISRCRLAGSVRFKEILN